eukprot:scaffold660704_cov65-Prasinocladus_malaysianus.AAC.1
MQVRVNARLVLQILCGHLRAFKKASSCSYSLSKSNEAGQLLYLTLSTDDRIITKGVVAPNTNVPVTVRANYCSL